DAFGEPLAKIKARAEDFGGLTDRPARQLRHHNLSDERGDTELVGTHVDTANTGNHQCIGRQQVCISRHQKLLDAWNRSRRISVEDSLIAESSGNAERGVRCADGKPRNQNASELKKLERELEPFAIIADTRAPRKRRLSKRDA